MLIEATARAVGANELASEWEKMASSMRMRFGTGANDILKRAPDTVVANAKAEARLKALLDQIDSASSRMVGLINFGGEALAHPIALRLHTHFPRGPGHLARALMPVCL